MNALEYIRSTDIAQPTAADDATPGAPNTIDLNKLPGGIVVGKTLIDVSNVASPTVRSGISLALLFANRVATNDASVRDEDAWLAAYQTALNEIGFRLSGTARLNSKFRETNVSVNKAIIPFLTIAFGGAAVGPVILKALEQLQAMEPESPWITLFNRESRKFSVAEMHFAAAVPRDNETEIRYAIARLDIAQEETQILFFKITKDKANFESLTTSMTANNSLIDAIEPELKARLEAQAKKFIWNAKVD